MLDKKYNALEKEEKWANYWEENKIFKFKRNGKPVYSIDTPPPTVSGKIHIGHVFSYSQAEMIARFKRLSGYNVFYPFGFDDNGLPSERLVEKEQGKKAHEIGREEFSRLCYETTDKFEAEFKELFNSLGFSVDWDLCYKTVSPSTTKISQNAFLDLIEHNHAYRSESPALWCNECLTSIAQAELETKTIKTTFNYINFSVKETGELFTIATTRPELLPAIVAVFVNPKDKAHKHLIGKTAVIPIIDAEVKILGDDKVAVDKGTGVVMCCTFGDQTDIEWWKKYKLPLKIIFTEDGRIKNDVKNYGGLKIKAARAKIMEDLTEAGVVVKVEDLEHEVQVHERCGKEVEYRVIKQWFVNLVDHKKEFLEIGKQIDWHPDYMRSRYTEWVENVMWDWCISRQRYFGVPFPVWYCKSCGGPIFAEAKDLPVNPLTDKPHKACKCGSTEFVPETDVMDTWATSSVSPQINMRLGEKQNYEDILRPMSLRCNASEIIRTWDFYTIAKSYYRFNEKPWDNVMISGYVRADDGNKVSKSKGNSKFEPQDVIKNYSADAVRYWAGTGRLGTDIAFNEETLLRGKKLINKLWNVSKFIEMHLADFKDKKFDDYEFFDKWILAKFSEVQNGFIKYLEDYEIGLALNYLEKFFWNFCDNYIEIVKHRLYRPEEFSVKARYSGQKTCSIILKELLICFSIFFPFITEEIYQNMFAGEKSIHLLELKPLNFIYEREATDGDALVEIISSVRGEKSNANVTLKTPVKLLDISLSDNLSESLSLAFKDFRATLFLENLNTQKLEEGYKINKAELNLETEGAN